VLWKVAGYGWPGRFAKPCDSNKGCVGSNPMPSAWCAENVRPDSEMEIMPRF
jgi:hypothetical protein